MTRTAEWLVVAVFVALLVAQPAAAATYPSADAACGRAGTGEVLVGVLPGASTPTDGQVLDGSKSGSDRPALYPGTTLRLSLCKDGDLKPTRGTEWSLEDTDGLKVLNRTTATVTVRVTDAAPAVDVTEHVSGKKNLRGVNFTVLRPATAESQFTDEPITFADESAADHYADNESAYLSALGNYTDASKRLQNAADAINESHGNVSVVEDNRSQVIRDLHNVTANRSKAVQARLYAAANRSDGDQTALTALYAAKQREQRANSKARKAMNVYLSALETAEHDARSWAWLNLAGALVVGLVAGTLPGWKLTANKLEAIRYDRQVNSSVSYSPRVLARAAGLAAAVLVLTLVALVALGGLGTLGGLL